MRKQRGFRAPSRVAPSTSTNNTAAAAGTKPSRKNTSLTIEQRKAQSLCAACGEKGHWKGDPVCSKSSQTGGRRNIHFVGAAEQETEWVHVLETHGEEVEEDVIPVPTNLPEASMVSMQRRQRRKAEQSFQQDEHDLERALTTQ
eukprot:3718127-Amphidinium_carterae.1